MNIWKITAIFAVGCMFALGFGQDIAREPGDDPGPEAELLDPEGWLTIFDGTIESVAKYWWISNASHGDGGNWWVAVDPELIDAGELQEDETILWSDQNAGGNGGILYTHRRYTDMETIIEVLPGWRNDGGVFLRSKGNGSAWQMMYDYQPGNTVGGIWPERLGGHQMQRMYTFVNESEINGNTISWDPGIWLEVWNPDGFNKVYSRITGRPPKMWGWIKEEQYVVCDYTASNSANELDDDGYIGLQIHGGTNSWQGGPNKYRHIKVREIDGDGNPLYDPPAPTILTQPQGNDSMNPGDNITLTVEATYGDMLNYQWKKDGQDIADATSATLELTNLQAADGGDYTVVLTNQVGDNATTSDAATIGVAVSIHRVMSYKSGQLNISWTSGNVMDVTGFVKDDYVIKVLDIKGNELARVFGKSGRVAHEIKGINEGVCFVHLRTENKTSIHKIIAF